MIIKNNTYTFFVHIYILYLTSSTTVSSEQKEEEEGDDNQTNAQTRAMDAALSLQTYDHFANEAHELGAVKTSFIHKRLCAIVCHEEHCWIFLNYGGSKHLPTILH